MGIFDLSPDSYRDQIIDLYTIFTAFILAN